MELSIRAMNPQERMYSYTQSGQIESQAGCIGHLRADMGSDGKDFFSSWTDHRSDLKTEDFKNEFDELINTLRSDKQYGDMLKDLRSLSKYCNSHPESSYGNDQDFGFRADTPSYTFMLRLNPHRGVYNLYCYCFRRDWLERHMKSAEKGIRFITPDYKEKFRLSDGDAIRVTSPGGESREHICRYIDDYHLEVGSSIYHICEYAEMLEHSKSTVIPIRSSLPERCFTVLQSTGGVVALERGKQGYFPTDDGGDPETARKAVTLLNQKLSVSKAQEAAMAAGSLFGWATPAADPKNYDAEGYALKPKPKDRGDAR